MAVDYRSASPLIGGEEGTYRSAGIITVKVDERRRAELSAFFDRFPKEANQVARSAVADALKHGRTQISSVIRENLNLPKKEVDDRITIRLPKTTPEGKIVIGYKRVPLISFRPSFSRSRGTTVTTVKSQGPQRFRHFFKQTTRPGRVGIFQRPRGVPRYPIWQAFGPSVISAFEQPEVQERALSDLSNYFLQRLRSKMDAKLAGKL